MELCRKEECLSCSACYAVCPKKAVRMEEDELGKLVPVIEEKLCINCGACRNVCPQLNPVSKEYPKSCFAAYSIDPDDQKKSSSGGIATLIGRNTILQGGVVFGSMFKNQTLCFGKVDNLKDLDQFRGSKYVYSFPDRIYSEVKKELLNGRLCTFVGLPCQTAGLKGYLNKNYDNLLTVDLICHGAPPYRYLEEHIEHLGLKEAYKKVSFRGERNFYLTILGDNDNVLYSKKQQEDPYFEAFMTRLTFRECCYACPFACNERISDITLGDFWGLHEGALNSYSGKVSCILINSEKGRDFIEGISDQMISELQPVEEAIAGNDQLREPSDPHPHRKEFDRYYIQNGFYVGLEKAGLLKRVRNLTIRNRVLYIPRQIKRAVKNKRAKT